MGKQALESQQDIMKYLLDGNTAELERGSIVSSQVDKLKEATTFQERQAAMQEVLNDLGYGGIAGLDTTINKQAEWEGMMYNAQDALSSMWLPLEKGAMDYIINLDEGTGHLLSMGAIATQVLGGPLIDVFLGLDPLYMGNEGKLVALVPVEQAEKAVEAMRGAKYGQDACIVGYVNDKAPGKLHLRTRIGGLRNMEVLQGEGLPRIC